MTDAPLSFRRARPDDVTDIVRMLADDPLGAQRERHETPLSETYMRAFRAIDADTNNELIVACRNDKAIGVLQLTFIPYLTYQGEDPEVGKYNGGQKILFFAASIGALALLLSGIVLWFPLSFGQGLREVSWLLHDVTFILFTASIIGHIYLGTASEPGTFSAMTRGAVSKRWARFHHPRWYREVTGEESRRR